MAFAVARKEGDLTPLDGAQKKYLTRIAEGGRDPVFADVGQAVHVVQPATTDDADLCFGQILSPPHSRRLAAFFRHARLKPAPDLRRCDLPRPAFGEGGSD